MATPQHASKLAEALAKIDELLEALKNGTFIGAGSPAAAAPAAAAPKAAAAAAAPRPAVPAAAPAAAAPAAAPSGKQAKKEKAKAAKPAAAKEEGDVFDKAHLAVGRVTSVSDHPSGSEKLWLCKVDVGGSERQVVAGLKQHISREELTGRLVAVVLNLKPAKLAGELSEAMILAADHAPEGGAVLVRVLSVPDSCQPGSAVYLQGGQPAGEYPKQVKSAAWGAIVAELAVAGGVARYKGTPLVTAAGPLTVAADMPDGAGIH